MNEFPNGIAYGQVDQNGRIPKTGELLDLPYLHLVQSAVNSKIRMTYLRANLRKKIQALNVSLD